jgi:hypothetical protein
MRGKYSDVVGASTLDSCSDCKFSATAWHIFSKILSLVSFCSNCTRALTYENLCPATCNLPQQCPEDGVDCCKDDPCNPALQTHVPAEAATLINACWMRLTPVIARILQPSARATGHIPAPAHSQWTAHDESGLAIEWGARRPSSRIVREGKFKIARFPGLTVEMWVTGTHCCTHSQKYCLQWVDKVTTLEC